jgi:hypothetical protein
MKRLFLSSVISLLFLSTVTAVFSQEKDKSLNSEKGKEAQYFDEEDNNLFSESDGKTVHSDAENKKQAFFFLFSEGAASSWLTRIIKQSERSNFVFKDFMLGIYTRVDMHIEDFITPMARLAVFYPLETTFNKYPQKPKTPLHIGMDMNLGVNFDILDFPYFRLNAGPAFHLFFLNSDRWNYFELGMAAFTGMELLISERWTLVCGFFASLDNGNFGSNRDMEPFDIVYQYQVDIGVRYSKKLKNGKFLFPPGKKALESSLIMR